MPATETGILAIRLQAVPAAVVPVVIGASLAVPGYDFKSSTNPLTLSVVGRGGGGPTPLANQLCW